MTLVALTFLAMPAAHLFGQTVQPAQTLAREVRDFASITAGQKTPVGSDMILAFERNKNGELVVDGIALLPAQGGSFPVGKDTVALLRIRGKFKTKIKTPDPEERRFANAYSIPVFIAREWAKPPVFWEFGTVNGMRSFRSIDKSGTAGPWSALPK
jgi:hypothetical protein